MIPKAIPMEIRHIIILLVFFILYVIFGGVVFMLLESPEEQIKRKEIENLLKDFTEHIKRLDHKNFTEQNFRIILHKILVAQNNNLIDSYGNQQSFINWSFINSFFFAITVITTIGYGHLTPTTVFGKIFCIIYALFGIPITSLLIGSVADRFSKLYSPKKIGLKRNHTYQKHLSARLMMLKKGLISLVPWFFAFLVVPALIFRHLEHWSFLDGFYYCFVTLSTIGFGDFVAGSFEKNYIWIYKIVVVFWIIFGLAYLSMVLNFITNSLRSRHISNVMQSLRLRIHSNGNFVSRMRRQQDHCHQNRYKRQQSSPVVIFNPNDTRILKNKQLNNSFINLKTIVEDKSSSNDMVKHNPKMIDMESCHHTKPTRQKINLSFLMMLKPINKNKQSNQKNNLKCAFEEPVISHINSLPELSQVDCIDPCCSINNQQVAKITIV